MGVVIRVRGHRVVMDHLPSPARAERNQRRKLGFIPVWPLVAGVVVLVAAILLSR